MIQWLGLRASTARAGSSQKKKIKSHHTPGKFKRIRNVNVKNKTIQVPKENMSRLPYNLVAWNTSYDSKIKQKGQRLMNFFFSFFFGRAARLVGPSFPKERSNLGPWQWEHGVLITGLPGNSLNFIFIKTSAWQKRDKHSKKKNEKKKMFPTNGKKNCERFWNGQKQLLNVPSTAPF